MNDLVRADEAVLVPDRNGIVIRRGTPPAQEHLGDVTAPRVKEPARR
jgi:hypothetical protein